jgi:hypothetical protein
MVKPWRTWFNRAAITTSLEVIGALLVVIGVTSWSLTAGIVVGGLALIGIGYLTA